MTDPEALLRGLNAAQREAVTFTGAPQLVLAGAGSGKTRVLTRKIAWLIAEKQVPAWKILAVTFTNKAAREMNERVSKLLGRDLGGAQICTFHSFGLKLLFRNREVLRQRGYKPDFVVYDRTDSLAAVKRLMKELDIDTEKYQPGWALNRLSEIKSSADPSSAPLPACEKFLRVLYEKYQAVLKEQGAFDFDDLIAFPLQLMRDDPQLLKREQERLDWVLVDEYQDVNDSQYRMMRLLVGRRPDLMVVGDPDQSIYGWRGANYATIMNFENDFAHAKVTLLEQNYRSTSMILDASNSLIQHNKNRREKDLKTDREAGEKVQVWYMQDEEEEAQALAREIHRLAGLYRYSDMAVLYRMNSLSRVLEQALIESGIPYRIVRGTNFYDRREVRDVVAFMRLAVNPMDLVSLNRVGNLPARALGPKSLEKLNAWMRGRAVGTAEDLWRTLQTEKGGLTGKAGEGASQLAGHMLTLLERQHNMSLVLTWILSGIGYENVLMKAEPSDWEERVENVRELLSVAPEGENLSEVLDQIALYSDADAQDETRDAVNLSSLHAAKGLEFPVVFMVGMEEGIFPHSRSSDTLDELEEERRLCYVGMTRAEERLYMSGARRRRLFGTVFSEGFSRFLAELPDEYSDVYEQKEVTLRYGRSGYGPYGRARRR